MTKFKKIGIIIGILDIGVITTFEIVRFIGRMKNKRTPKDGINEERMIDINGTKQWISIYGKNINNPVLLFLHGGPGGSTSIFDYVITRKWSDVYTVVSWDQRNCGKSYSKSQKDIKLSKEVFLKDGKEITEFILNYLKKDKITLLGHSWGTFYGCSLIHAYPSYYENYIGAGQMVDFLINEKALQEEAKKWAKEDEEDLARINRWNPEKKVDREYAEERAEILRKYHYFPMENGMDFNVLTAILFNPYYSLIDYYHYFSSHEERQAYYEKFEISGGLDDFSLKMETNYEVPYYNILGERDYMANHKMAQDYFELVKAPHKKLYIMRNMGHGLLLERSEEFSDLVHDIYKNEYFSS